jgi:uncharacterized membrane protein
VEHPFFSRTPLSTLDLASLIAVGFVLLVAADWMGAFAPAVPSVLWLTTFALIVGHIGPFKDAPGAMQLGTLALHFFFVVIGIYSRIDMILLVGMSVFFYTVVVVGVHGVVVYGVGRLLGMDIATITVAVAISREWNELVLPGIAVGLLGYALRNYVGFGLGYLVRSLGIGL